MKKWLVALLVLLFVSGGLVAYAAQTDYFEITITVGYISIELLNHGGGGYGPWAIGAVDESTITTMEAWGDTGTTEGVHVSNESNVAIDLSCWAGDSLTWTLAGAQGADQYTLAATSETTWVDNSGPADMSNATAITATSSPGDDVETGITAGAERYWFFNLGAPTSVGSGDQNTITVTIEASGS